MLIKCQKVMNILELGELILALIIKLWHILLIRLVGDCIQLILKIWNQVKKVVIVFQILLEELLGLMTIRQYFTTKKIQIH